MAYEGDAAAGLVYTSNGPGQKATFQVAGAGDATNIGVDANTAPGTNPVLQDGMNTITLTGGQVAAGTIGANVIQTNSLAASTATIQIQQSDVVAAKDTTLNGVSHFNDAQFTIDEGFVSLVGGGTTPAYLATNVDATSGGGTDPVVADATGTISVTGGQIATGTIGANVLRTISTAANSYTVQIQQTSAAAAQDTTLNGVAHFDSSIFTVTNGFVTTSLLPGPPSRTKGFSYFDDFLNYFNDSGFSYRNGPFYTTINCDQSAPDTLLADHPGIWRMVLSSGPNVVASISSNNTPTTTATLMGLRLTGGEVIHESLIYLTALSSAASRFVIFTGMTNNSSYTLITNGVYIRYSDNINAGVFEAVCNSGGVTTTLTSGTAAVINTWYKLTIVVNAAGTSVEFFLNGVSFGTIATNIPTTVKLASTVAMSNTAALAAARNSYCDYIFWQKTLTTPR